MKVLIISFLLFAAISAQYIQPNYGYNPYPLQPNPFGPGPRGFGSYVEPYNYRRDHVGRQPRRYFDEDSGEYDRPRELPSFGYQPFGYQPIYGYNNQASYGSPATPVSSAVFTYGSK